MDQETQAFPKPTPGTPGMTLRDYFAAAALTGMLARANSSPPAGKTRQGYATSAYDYADGMLAERGAK